MRKSFLHFCCFLFAGLYLAPVLADTVEEVLSYKDAPAGVVFEIVSDDEDQLERALPTVKLGIAKLRKRFPGLPIAVVSHGQEQFALTEDNRDAYRQTHKQVQSLVADDKTNFHVCGTFAAMNNVGEDEFPDYVDVAPHGPLQIRSYEEFGYVKILVD